MSTSTRKTVSRRQSKKLYHTLIIAGVGLLFAIFTTLIQPFSSVRLWLSDQLFVAGSPSPNIVIIGIDDDTLRDYGKWSGWSRLLHAKAIDNLSEAGAKVIGFDILFVDSSPDDQLFAASIENAGNVVLSVVGSEPLPSISDKVTYNQLLWPVPVLKDACIATGHANVIPDRDGKVRRLPLVIQDRTGQVCPALSLAMLHTLFSMPLPDDYQIQNGAIHLLARDIPIDPEYQLRINFSADTASYPYLSYGDVISGNFDPQVVRNKIVIIGMTATGEYDMWSLPTSAAKVPGVYVHAAVMDTILRSQFLTDAGRFTTLWIMLLLVAITALALPGLRLKWGGVLVAGLFVIYLVVSFLIFDRGYILNLLYPPVLLVLVYISSIATMIVIEQSEKRFVTGLFGRYVSPQVADQILSLADAGKLQLGGEQREVTILFADIRGFTKLSEQLSPEEIVSMLNIYLSLMIDKILANGGMVNKFAGDNIMAVWNAPQFQKDHALLAAKAAWDSQQAIMALQEKDSSLPRVQFGIGINTGPALAGNIGSAGRSEYTVIGDAVNLASRICGATTGTQVWLGPDTYHQIKERIEAVALEPQRFKGKSEPIVVYHLTGWK